MLRKKIACSNRLLQSQLSCVRECTPGYPGTDSTWCHIHVCMGMLKECEKNKGSHMKPADDLRVNATIESKRARKIKMVYMWWSPYSNFLKWFHNAGWWDASIYAIPHSDSVIPLLEYLNLLEQQSTLHEIPVYGACSETFTSMYGLNYNVMLQSLNDGNTYLNPWNKHIVTSCYQ